MTGHIRPFAELRMGDRPEVGGKCASLGELLWAGIDVPDGFAVTVSAFEQFRDTGTLRTDLRGLVRGADPASSRSLQEAHGRATALVRATPVPPDIDAAVREAYAALCRAVGAEDDALPVAVRSSAVAEDGDAASFAGQQETYLWVVGAESVVEHIRACWASLYTPQAIAYRTRLSEEQAHEATRISVAVQAMVDADVSGVAFTVSPRTGDRSVVALNASWGLGHAVVSGEVTPDEYWVSKVGPRITATTVATKTRRCVADPSGAGTRSEDVPAELRDVACLSEDDVLALTELAVRIEEHYGCPQDIEWSRTGDRFLVLQSRPETSWRGRRAKARAARPAGYLGLVQAAAKAATEEAP